MNKKLFFGFVILNIALIITFLMSATGVLISNNAGNAHSSAALEIRSTSQGFLPPVLTTSERDNISNPATGLTIYNSSTGTIESFNGSNWQGTTGGSGSAPVGTVMAFAGTSIPSGWLECNGAEVNRSTYANLYNVIGTAWGYGDQTYTFNLPDMRGRFLRGHDNGEGNDPDASSRVSDPNHDGGNSGDNVGSFQSDVFKSHNHGGGSHAHSTSSFSARGYPDGSGDRTSNYYFMHSSKGTDYSLGTTSSGTIISTQGGNETRPQNVSVKYIIKY